MAVPVVFTHSYWDMSVDDGFQWEFQCNRCSSAYRSPFQQNPLARGRGVLRSLSSLAGDAFGGAIWRVSNAADSFSHGYGGGSSSTKDAAFARAVEQIRSQFQQCGACGDWVCVNVCWNSSVGVCQRCSPSASYDIARAQAGARSAQFHAAAAQQDWTADYDTTHEAQVRCHTCGATTDAGRFCSSCGSALADNAQCRGCGNRLAYDAMFCSRCGQAR